MNGFIHIVEYCLTPKRNELSSYEKTWRKVFHAYYKLKKANLKKLHTYDSSYMTFQKVQNNRESKELVGRDGEGNGTLLQYSCLENPMNGGAW